MCKIKIPYLLPLIFLLFSCAGSVYDAGRSSLRREQYNEAIKFFKLAAEADSLNHKNFRELGIAYFKADSSEPALSNLRKRPVCATWEEAAVVQNKTARHTMIDRGNTMKDCNGPDRDTNLRTQTGVIDDITMTTTTTAADERLRLASQKSHPQNGKIYNM